MKLALTMSHILEDDKIGHRKRLKESFIRSPYSLHDYEILEMVLFWSVPRRDVKHIAKKLLKEFKDLTRVINATHDKLLSIEGITESMYINMRLLKEVLSRCLKTEISNKNILSSWSALIEYLQGTQGSMQTEQLRVLFLTQPQPAEAGCG